MNNENEFSNSEANSNNNQTSFANNQFGFNNEQTMPSNNNQFDFNNNQNGLANNQSMINNNQPASSYSQSNFNNNQSMISNSQTGFNNGDSQIKSINNNQINTTGNEIDDYFAEPKKKHTGLIIMVMLLIIIIFSACYYYFIFDNPKTIFSSIISDVLNKANIQENNENHNMDYSLNLNIKSTDKEMKNILEIINNFKISGTISMKDGLNGMSSVINYKNKLLLDYNALIDTKDASTFYFKLNNLYDKVLKVEMTGDNFSTSIVDSYDTNINDYKQILVSFKTAVNSSLKTASYNKQYTKNNNQTVKKISLIIDEKLITNICNKLLQDSAFINSYAKVNDMSNEEVSDMLNEDIREAKGNNEIISIYLTALKNEFIKFEYTGNEDALTVTKDNDQYNFDLSENYTSLYQGYIKNITVNNNNNIIMSISSVEAGITFQANVEYSLDKNKDIDPIDTTNAINIEDIPDADYEAISEKLLKNDAFNKLIEDCSSIFGSLDTDISTPNI